MTTLQLARRIADAVLAAAFKERLLDRADADSEDPPTQAVLRTLHETGSWFCRLREEEQRGVTVTVEEPYPG